MLLQTATSIAVVFACGMFLTSRVRHRESPQLWHRDNDPYRNEEVVPQFRDGLALFMRTLVWFEWSLFVVLFFAVGILLDVKRRITSG